MIEFRLKKEEVLLQVQDWKKKFWPLPTNDISSWSLQEQTRQEKKWVAQIVVRNNLELNMPKKCLIMNDNKTQHATRKKNERYLLQRVLWQPCIYNMVFGKLRRVTWVYSLDCTRTNFLFPTNCYSLPSRAVASSGGWVHKA